MKNRFLLAVMLFSLFVFLGFSTATSTKDSLVFDKIIISWLDELSSNMLF